MKASLRCNLIAAQNWFNSSQPGEFLWKWRHSGRHGFPPHIAAVALNSGFNCRCRYRAAPVREPPDERDCDAADTPEGELQGESGLGSRPRWFESRILRVLTRHDARRPLDKSIPSTAVVSVPSQFASWPASGSAPQRAAHLGCRSMPDRVRDGLVPGGH